MCLLLAGRSTGVASREHALLKEYCALFLNNVRKHKGIDGRKPVGQQVSPPLVTCAFSGKFIGRNWPTFTLPVACFRRGMDFFG